jgi:hypothetical protein
LTTPLEGGGATARPRYESGSSDGTNATAADLLEEVTAEDLVSQDSDIKFIFTGDGTT